MKSWKDTSWADKAEEDYKSGQAGTFGEDDALSWDSEISKESEFILLEPGVYDFTVTNLDRGYFDGSEKMGPCPKAEIELEVISKDGQKVKLFENLFLSKKSEWKLSEFFISIGQKRPGEPLRMDWGKVLGSTGKCQVYNNEYNGQKYNRVRKFIASESREF